MKSKSDLYRLDPFLDTYGILHLGGRIQNAEISDRIKYPLVLPNKGHVTNLIARHFHDKTLHKGRGMTVNEIRNCGFWIIGASSVVSGLIAKCVVCRKLRGTTQDQNVYVSDMGFMAHQHKKAISRRIRYKIIRPICKKS